MQDFELLRILPDATRISGWNYSSKIEYETFNFSGGEVHIKINSNILLENVRINCRIKKSDDLIRLMLVVDALRAMGTQYIETFIPYIPYARQDRRMVKGEPLSIKVFSNILNSLKLNKVICYDSHSEVAIALIDNVEHHYNFEEVWNFISDHIPKGLHDLVIISPDGGSYKKINKMTEYWGTRLARGIDVIMASKIRNVTTGKITGTEVYGSVKDKNCLIVDDICEGGKTFIELGKILKEKGAKDLYLFVSHGIFSKGYDELFEYYEQIGTTNSFKKETEYPIRDFKLKVINLEI